MSPANVHGKLTWDRVSQARSRGSKAEQHRGPFLPVFRPAILLCVPGPCRSPASGCPALGLCMLPLHALCIPDHVAWVPSSKLCWWMSGDLTGPDPCRPRRAASAAWTQPLGVVGNSCEQRYEGGRTLRVRSVAMRGPEINRVP